MAALLTHLAITASSNTFGNGCYSNELWRLTAILTIFIWTLEQQKKTIRYIVLEGWV